MYGKLIDNRVTPAPIVLASGDRVYYNPSAETYRAAGYLPVIETPCPAPPEEADAFLPRWEEQDGRIVRVWAARRD